MKYALLIHTDPDLAEKEGTPEYDAMFQAYYQFTEDITKEGINLGGEALHGIETATTVRVRSGERTLTDGPFAETKEHFGGFYLIEAADIDAAVDVAARIPGVNTGSVEIRPVVDFG